MRAGRPGVEDRPILPHARSGALPHMFISERIVNDDVRALRDRISGEVVSPADAAYDQARLAWNLAADQRPGLVVFPESADDVVEIVLYARRNGLQIAPQGTGHNASPIVWSADMIL